MRAALAIRDWAQDEQIQVRLAVNTGGALITLGTRPWLTRTSCELPNPSMPWERPVGRPGQVPRRSGTVQSRPDGGGGDATPVRTRFLWSVGAIRFIHEGAALLAALPCRSMTA